MGLVALQLSQTEDCSMKHSKGKDPTDKKNKYPYRYKESGASEDLVVEENKQNHTITFTDKYGKEHTVNAPYVTLADNTNVEYIDLQIYRSDNTTIYHDEKYNDTTIQAKLDDLKTFLESAENKQKLPQEHEFAISAEAKNYYHVVYDVVNGNTTTTTKRFMPIQPPTEPDISGYNGNTKEYNEALADYHEDVANYAETIKTTTNPLNLKANSDTVRIRTFKLTPLKKKVCS